MAQISKTSMEIAITYCLLMPHIIDCISIEFIFEQRCAKFIWSCLNSSNTIIKLLQFLQFPVVTLHLKISINAFSCKYNIGIHIMILSLNEVVKCILLYMSNENNLLYYVHGKIIHDLFLASDNHCQSPHLLSCTESVMLMRIYAPHSMHVLLFSLLDVH